jgi:hypothetical protein
MSPHVEPSGSTGMQDDYLEPTTRDATPVAEETSGPNFEPASNGEEGAYAEPVQDPPAAAPPAARRRWVALLAMAIIVLLLVGGLTFSGHLGTLISPNRGSPPGVDSVSFSSAYDSVNSSVQSTPGGPWTLWAASGVDIPSDGSLPTPSNFSTGGPCPVKASPPFVTASPTDAIRGVSPNWELGFESTAGNALLTAVVVNGDSEVLGTIPISRSCGILEKWGTLPPVRNIEDSTQFAPALPNLTLFTRTYPNASVVFNLGDEVDASGKVSGVAFWSAFAGPCFTSTSDSNLMLVPGDPYYQGVANATSSQSPGDYIFPGIGSCETPGNLGPSLKLAAPQFSFAGSGYGYTVNVQAAAGGVTPEKFRPVLVGSVTYTPLGSNASIAVTGFEVHALNGSTLAVYNYSVGAWTQGGNIPLTAGDSFELYTNRQIDGASLVLIANPPETGDIGLDIP